MLQEKEHYLYELPDFIMGKADPKIAAEIEALILSDPAFREEYEQLKGAIGDVNQFLSLATEKTREEVPPGYFNDFAMRVQDRIHNRRVVRRFWDELRGMVSGWMPTPVSLPELGTAFAGFAVVATLFAFAISWNGRTELENKLASQGSAVQLYSIQEETDLATLSYANGVVTESMLSTLSDDQVDFLLKKLDKKVPATKVIIGTGDDGILLDEDIDALLKLL